MTNNPLNSSGPDAKNGRVPHIPVLLDHVLTLLDPQKGESYLDLTAGYGGHAQAVLERTLSPNRASLIDRDHNAVASLMHRFGSTGVTVINNDYHTASKEFVAHKAHFDIILADLGVSSPQLDEPGRGFSLVREGPLDMRMDQHQELTAEEVVNSYSEAQLTDLLRRYGEEPKAGKIARLIIANRPLSSTHQLATIVAQAWPGYSKIHPATRTFQALRIAVNEELRQLSDSLPLWVDLLSPGGRLAIISFHSLEDRIVKQYFSEHSHGYEAELTLLTKKPIIGSTHETVSNPRARSAKLRAVAKIKTKI